MVDSTPTLNAADIISMLRRHYVPENRPPAGVFAPEIQSPCGARRADLIWLSTTIAGGRFMVGHEVKVARSDVIAELRDPSKADPWAQYCDQWWLVISDPTLIDGLEIPAAWGIMAPPSGRRTRSMTILRPAPKLTPSAAADGVSRITAWLNQRYVELDSQRERDMRWRDGQIERAERTIADLRTGGSTQPSPHAKRINELASRVEKGLSERRVWGRPVEDDDIVSALIDLGVIRHHSRDMVRALRGLRSDLETARKAIDGLPDVSDDDELPFGGVA